ncbi:MAG: UDP-3-O-(3-hydroxymyristoyl)glucosamine N-acyltransferase [Deferribacteraceae bacterium]|jgi:UDP-3-O-[3-hydroxymyristoyl] glucosamine N-acyltransferase|nr:UDP-3-O-(3-hydroxymyristoyl)glucosamine N-acyltransferase [Deferribacteraceae bacterium]
MAKLSEIAKLLDSTISGDDIEISGLSLPNEQKEGTISVLGTPKLYELASGAAAAYIVPDDSVDTKGKPFIVVKNHRLAIVSLLNYFIPEKPHKYTISPKASIVEGATVEDGVSIGDFVSVGDGSSIRKGTRIYPGVVIGENVSIGENCIIYPNVVIYDNAEIGNHVIILAGASIGSDGFGFVPGQIPTKIPHKGNVVLKDHVEIGANSTIDRGTIGSTVIGVGTKIDNLCQVAHNVQIGTGCFIASQTGISGSTIIGDYVFMGGQVGIADHATVGSFVSIAAQSGVHGTIEDKANIGGTPMQPIKDWARQVAAAKQLPEMKKRIIALEKKIGE